jgi:hypothetical protein
MRQLGFDPTENMSPLQFLMAVYNDRLDLIFKNVKRRARAESKGGISIAYRLEAAKTVAKYIHMEMPKMQINESEKDTFGKDLAEAAARGNDRIRTKRIILEAVERISPDIPLPPASYPPDFEEMIQGSVVREVQEEEGDTSYNPDDDD